MDFVTIIGFSAAFCTTTAYLPQVIKSFRTRSTKDLSWGLILLFFFGTLLWLVYGILRKDIVIILANGVTLIFNISLLSLKFRYK